MATGRQTKRASAAHPSPTDQEWARVKPVIVSMYLNGATLEDTAEHLRKTFDFHCTLRQYKGKISNWGLPSKRLRKDIYQAMYTIAVYCSSHGRNVYFIAQRGCQDREITLPQARKELNRKGQAQGTHAELPDEDKLREALSVVSSNSARIMSNDVVISPDLKAIYNFCSQHRPSSSTLAPMTNDSVASHGQTSPRPASNSHGMSPEVTMGSPGAWEAQSYQTSNSTSRSDLPVLMNAVAGQRCNYDIDDILGGVSSFQLLVDSYPGHRPGQTSDHSGTIPPLDVNYDVQKAAARQWAFPFFLHCFRVTDTTVEFDNKFAMSELQRMLTTDWDNKYIFVLLNWMVCILYFNGKTRALDPFLQASLEAIKTTLGPDSPFCVVFNYALAFVRQDFVGSMQWGSRLLPAQRDIENMCGRDHPNSIVNLYYWAYYCWQQGQIQDGLDALESCQPRVEKVMNPNYLLTIQCIALRARIYAQTKQHQYAIQTVEEALSRFHYRSELLIAYRLDLTHLLALSQSEVGNLVQAERLLLEVVRGRVALTGLLTFGGKSMTQSWEAIFDLKRVMELQGRHEHAKQMVQGYQNQYYEELRAKASPEASPRPPESAGSH